MFPTSLSVQVIDRETGMWKTLEVLHQEKQEIPGGVLFKIFGKEIRWPTKTVWEDEKLWRKRSHQRGLAAMEEYPGQSVRLFDRIHLMGEELCCLAWKNGAWIV